MRYKYLDLFVLSVGLMFALSGTVNAYDTMKPEVKVFSNDAKTLESSFLAYAESFKGGGSVAVGDVDGDRFAEIIVGAGRGGGPHVRVFTKKGVPERVDFFPFHRDFRGGISVATGDTDGDGKDELIVAQMSKGEAWVKVYNVDSSRFINAEFLAFPRGFEKGARVAAGDINGDGKAEIAVASGLGGGPVVKFFDGRGNNLHKDFFAFDTTLRGGATLDFGDIDNDGIDELFVGNGGYGPGRVKIYRMNGSHEVVVSDFLAYSDSMKKGVRVAAADINNDGKDEIVTVPGHGSSPHMRAFLPNGKPYMITRMAYDSNFGGGVSLSAGDVDKDGKVEIVTIPDRAPGPGSMNFYKYIEVSIGEQRLWAYENGEVVKTFLVSTGVDKYPTPIGLFAVRDHIVSQRMKFEYGYDHPDNYDLPDVPNVMHFSGGYALHGAYWHNNFGRKMSHGCINISLPNAFWLFHWADNGNPVVVKP